MLCKAGKDEPKIKHWLQISFSSEIPMGITVTILQALWFIWPAYTANAFPAVLRGKKPIDGGRKLGGAPLLGKSKTVEGTIGGILFGIFIGLVQIQLYDYLPDLGLVKFSLPMIVALSVGALFGDILGSFIKRRIGAKPGRPVLLLDQLDFLVVSLLLVSFVYLVPIELAILLVVLTPAIHFLTNIVGYAAKLKKDPW